MRLSDDGSTVVLDLHGARVVEAVPMARRALAHAARRGRHRLDLVHGTSTSDPFGERATLKRALHDWLGSSLRPSGVLQVQRGEAVLSLYLDVTAQRDARPLTLRDVRAEGSSDR